MVTTILMVLAAIVAIPIALIVAWNFIKLFFAIISDVAGLIFSILVFAIIIGIFVIF
jgi:hypothetical protein